MAASGFTPISLYYSTTASAVPTSGNLANGELGLNINDMKLYAKNSSGVVTLLASNASTGATVSSVAASVPAFLSITGSPITTSGTLAITLSGTALPVANGGTGLTTTPANGALDIGNGTGFTRTTLTAGTGVTITNASGSITINATGTGGTVTSVAVSGGTTGLTTSGGPITSSGTITLAGTLGTANGGTNLTSFTSGGVVYASSTSALATGSALTFDGTSLSTTGQVLLENNKYIGFKNTTGTYAASIFNDTSNFLNLYNSGNTGTIFYVNAAEQMRLTSTGLGIGTSSPSSKLDVSGVISLQGTTLPSAGTARIFSRSTDSSLYLQAASGGTMNFLDGSQNSMLLLSSSTLQFLTGNTERARIDSSGNVGIGTTSPSTYGKFAVVGSGGTHAAIANTDTGSVGTVKTYLDLYGTNTSTALKLQATLASSPGLSASSGGCMVLYTNDGSSTSQERVRIDENGNVGIGTSSPSYAVDIKTASSNSLRVGSSANSFGSLLEWNNASGWGRVGTLGGYPFDLATNGSTRFRIGESGQFGIGGATYGTSGQVLTSGGASAAPTWTTPSTASGTVTSVTVSAGTGMSGGGTVTTSGTITLTNAGVTSVTAGTGISVSASTGSVTITSTAASGAQAFVAFGTTGGF